MRRSRCFCLAISFFRLFQRIFLLKHLVDMQHFFVRRKYLQWNSFPPDTLYLASFSRSVAVYFLSEFYMDFLIMRLPHVRIFFTIVNILAHVNLLRSCCYVSLPYHFSFILIGMFSSHALRFSRPRRLDCACSLKNH